MYKSFIETWKEINATKLIRHPNILRFEHVFVHYKRSVRLCAVLVVVFARPHTRVCVCPYPLVCAQVMDSAASDDDGFAARSAARQVDDRL
jgi:hypothetical protein